ncbi:hypothetical protein MKX01_002505 [Papaver californicum]|nr:hypothetical protein MKX01_002505 [Papaver californicum]
MASDHEVIKIRDYDSNIDKTRVGNLERIYTKNTFQSHKSRLPTNRVFPCMKVRSLPDIFNQFGFYFMYGLYCKGTDSGSLVHSLCQFVHNMARKCKDCKVIVTEIGGDDIDKLKAHIPHWKTLSCSEDLWCVKALKIEEKNTIFESIRCTHPRTIFVDPREV